MCGGKYCEYCGIYDECKEPNKNKGWSSSINKMEYNKWIPYNESKINKTMTDLKIFNLYVLMKFNSSLQFGMFHRLEEEGNKQSIYSPEKDRFIDMDIAIPDYIMIINEEVI